MYWARSAGSGAALRGADQDLEEILFEPDSGVIDKLHDRVRRTRLRGLATLRISNQGGRDDAASLFELRTET